MLALFFFGRLKRREMRKIVVASIKGGVGKTTVSSGLTRSLKRLGFSVGYLDADITAPTSSEAFGLEKPPDWELDAAADGGKGTIVPYDVDGIQFITLASHFGQAPAVLWNEERKIDAARQLLQGVVAWGNLDWLVLDTPPSSSAEMQALYDYITALHGVILVFQPTDMAAADLLRTLDFLKFKKVPILGLVSNMSYCVSPLGERFWPFLSPEIDLAQICKEFGIPLLGEIPLTPDRKVVEQTFDEIASRLDGAKSVILKEDIATRLIREGKRRLLKTAIRRL
ncbi:P-loop NTPase [Patescibacteria group bacterium]|nr:P-loop NTPase [Patescibacteria group bacterium]MBU0847387.1 P-loop NTPase [Patescibacteria group bacterium]